MASEPKALYEHAQSDEAEATNLESICLRLTEIVSGCSFNCFDVLPPLKALSIEAFHRVDG